MFGVGNVSVDGEVEAVVREVAAQVTDEIGKVAEGGATITSAGLGAFLHRDHVANGLHIEANDLKSLVELCHVALSPSVPVQVGMNTSIFSLGLLERAAFEKVQANLRALGSDREKLDQFASKMMDFASRVGCECSTMRCHVGELETVLPIPETVPVKRRFGVCVRGVASGSLTKVKEEMAQLLQLSEKAVHHKNTEESATTDVDDVLQPVKDQIKRVKDACKLSEVASEKMCARLASYAIAELGLSAQRCTERGGGEHTYAEVFPKYSSIQHKFSTIHSKSKSLGCEVSLCVGGVSDVCDTSSTCRTDVIMYHSPKTGSVVYSLDMGTKRGGSPSVYSDVAPRSTSSSLLSAVCSDGVAIGATSKARGNQHFSLDAVDGTYRPMLACPRLFSSASDMLKVGADITIIGSPVDYEHPPSIRCTEDLSRFISTLALAQADGEVEADGMLFVPDVESAVSGMITKRYPASFFEYLTNAAAVKHEDSGRLAGWMLPARTVKELLDASCDI